MRSNIRPHFDYIVALFNQALQKNTLDLAVLTINLYRLSNIEIIAIDEKVAVFPKNKGTVSVQYKSTRHNALSNCTTTKFLH
jgi:hypothetical protein